MSPQLTKRESEKDREIERKKGGGGETAMIIYKCLLQPEQVEKV
jgi:hypothetical protein